MRDSFVFYRSFAESVKNLPPEEYKKVMQSILDYALDGKEPEQSGIEYTVFCLVKPQIDANNKRYENGRKGGRPKPSDNQELTKVEPNNNQTITKPKPNNNQTVTTTEPNVYVNDNVNVNVNDKKDIVAQTEYPYKAVIDYLNKKTGREFKDKSKDSRNHIKARCDEGYTLEDFKKVIDNKVSEWGVEPRNGEKDMRPFLRPCTLFGSSRNFENYLNQGLSKLGNGGNSKFRNFEERRYDMDKLTRELLGG